MKLLVRQIEVPLDYTDKEILIGISKKLKCSINDISGYTLQRRSLDARPRRKEPIYILQAEVRMKDRFFLKSKNNKDFEVIKFVKSSENIDFPRFASDRQRPIVIGAGPAGLMAALHLSVMRLKPILFERGAMAEERKEQVTAFWRSGALNTNSNVLFGEGGAGLFSDGKLTARSKDRPRIRLFLETLVRCGAPKEILLDAEPHLGSDVLLTVVPKIRQMIEENGGEINYNTPLSDIYVEDGQITAIHAGHSLYKTQNCILATGHSARDVYHILAERGAALEQKPFAVGIRLEVPQKDVNFAQLGKFAGHKKLGAASFKLTRRPEENTRACFSFCMCPGGLVISCASENNALTTNGMSFSGRDGIWANAAFIVPVEPKDYDGYQGPETAPELAGINFQKQIEKAAFKAGGNGFSIPCLRLQDFLDGKISESLPPNRSCRRSRPASFDEILPDYVLQTLRTSIPKMLTKLNGVNLEDAVVYAAETRSSSPVRILRNDYGQNPNIKGLFPAGEGAGYAGGIVSSAVDGLKAAEQLIDRMKL